MLCAHHVPIDYECAACTEVRRASSGAYSAGLADGARGRGSRRRYRAAVVEAIERWEAEPAHYRGASGPRHVSGLDGPWVAYGDSLGRRHEVPLATWRWRRDRAARHARRILAALDGS